MSDKPPHLTPPPLPPHAVGPSGENPRDETARADDAAHGVANSTRAAQPPPPLPPPPQRTAGPPRPDHVRPGLDGPPSAGRPAPRPPARPIPYSARAEARPGAEAGHPRTENRPYPPHQRPPPYQPAPRPPASQSPGNWPSADRSRPDRSWSIAGVFGLLFVGLFVAVAAGLAFLVLAPPVEFMKAQAIAEVKQRTGRDLTISGPVTFTVFPTLTLKMRGVSLSGPAEMASSTPFAVAGSIEARVKPLPLLQRRVAIDSLVLTDPVIDLRVDAKGRRNWEFARPARAAAARRDAARVEVAQAPPPAGSKTDDTNDAVKDFLGNASNPDNPSASESARIAALDDLTLGEVRLTRGTIHYADERSGTDETVSAVDATLSLTALQNPLETSGTLSWNGETVGFDAKLASPRALLEERPARLKLALKAAPLDARFEGSLIVRSAVELDGDLAANGPSLRDFARWVGTELPPSDGFAAARMEAKLKAGPRGIVLSDASATLDGATATGTIAVEPGPTRPKLTGNLKVSYLDLNRYSLAPATSAARKPATARTKPSVPKSAAPRSIEELIEKTVPAAAAPATKVKGYTATDGWSGEPIPLDALGAADADLRIATGGLRWRDIKAGQAIVTIALKSKVLRVNLDEVAFYDGRGRGVVTLDANPLQPIFGANLSADDVSGLGLLQDAAGYDRISGKAKVALALGARGQSQLELVESLAGKAEFAFANGALKGVNIGGALKAIERRQIPNFKTAPNEATEFSELAVSFQIDKGIARSTDLQMASPLLRVGGAGQIALTSRTIDYVLKPKLVASGEGQGAADKSSGDKLAGLEIPLKVKGPLADPTIEPDLAAVLKDPNKAIDAVKEIVRPFKGTGSSLLKSLIGKEPKSESQPSATGGAPAAADGAAESPPPQKIDPKKLLEGVLGR